MPAEHYFYPNIYGRIMLEAVEAEIGKEAMVDLLEQAEMSAFVDNYPPGDMHREYPFECVGQLGKAIYDRYGSEQAREIAHHTGRNCFDAGLGEFKDLAAAISPVLYKGSLEKKCKMGLEIYARFFNMISDQRVEVDMDDEAFFWRIKRCPICWGWEATEPVCYLAVGTLEGAFEWLTGGKKFKIVETDCVAKGDPDCVIRINKTPLDG